MNLEPEVVKSITRNRRRVSLHKMAAMMPLVLVLVVTLGLIIWVRLGPSSTQINIRTLQRTGIEPEDMLTFALRLLPLFVVFFVAIRRLLVPARRQYRALIARPFECDEDMLSNFKRDLEGVAIGMGVQAPTLVVVVGETPTAFTFRKGGTDFIAVTEALLKADLSQAEREAVMAHELAHSVDGDALQEPDAWRGMTGVLFILAPVVVMLTGLFSGVSEEKLLLMAIVPSVLLVVGWPLSIWLLVRPYNLTAMKSLGHYSDVLADSVAAKVTSNPDALRGAIVKLRDLTEAAVEMPSESIGFTHMFIGPLKEWPLVRSELLPTMSILMQRQYSSQPVESPLARSSNRFVRALFTPVGELNYPSSPYHPSTLSATAPEQESTKKVNRFTLGKASSSRRDYALRQAAIRQMGPFIAWQKELIAERLINLDNIKQNRWQVFELKRGSVMVKPSSWR